ncbi:tyrosine recombinase XerC [Miniphocaeibacter massiliensis]|uniref:tyrosine recombinase XerC n=1 Tax=Miniphocaeibacter massiliensis TaxID=2041841 RepID=UPI001A933A3A|nr:tyrosine recombinase XerC [Miniphocaeibacter massiliensis]
MFNYPLILTDYLAYMETIKGRSPNTTKEYGYDISKFLKFIYTRFESNKYNYIEFEEINISNFPDSYFKKIELSDLHAYLAFLDRKFNDSTTTRARKVSSLRSFFKYLVTIRKILDINPTDQLETPKKQSRNPVYLTLDESIRLLKSVDSIENEVMKKRDRCILILFLNCGMRLSELSNIKISDIKNDTLQVVGKGNKQRTIYLNKSCNVAIDDYLKVRPPTDDEYLFLSNRKSQISNRAIQRRVDYYLEKSGFDTKIYSTHKLRHTAATLMFKHGDVDIKILQEILGHVSVATTQIYTHVDDESLREAINKNPLSDI